MAPHKATVAGDMLAAMPERAVDIIMNGNFAGTDLVRLSSEIHRPSFKDCRLKLLSSLSIEKPNMVVCVFKES